MLDEDLTRPEARGEGLVQEIDRVEAKAWPLIKFPGGKRWLVEDYAGLLPKPERVRRYHEPFVGGGAVAGVYLSKVACSISDMNPDLIATYRAVRTEPESVIRSLAPLAYDPDVYARVRGRFNAEREASDSERAAWFLYLNRAGYNGLVRYSQKGTYNVPFGRYTNPTICDPARIRAASRRLRGASILQQDFTVSCRGAKPGDFIFLDPPYLNEASSFTAYSAGGFGPADQLRLVEELRDLTHRGVRWLLTNADTEANRALFAEWNLCGVQVKRAINSKGSGRGAVGELLVSNWPLLGFLKREVERGASEEMTSAPSHLDHVEVRANNPKNEVRNRRAP